MRNIGFAGMGNMGTALARGLIGYAGISKKRVYAYAPNYEKLKENAREIGFTPCRDMESMVDASDLIILACKPHQIEGVLKEAGESLNGKAVLSVAANIYHDDIAQIVDTDKVHVQCMIPNTPVSVGEGVFLFERENSLDKKERDELISLFDKTGKVIELEKELMAAGTALTGCGPAFVDMFIEAMSDGGVKNGLRRQDTYEMICRMITGAAKLVIETGTHPGELKDRVCSPGGTTIRGVAALEESGFRDGIIKAVDATLK